MEISINEKSVLELNQPQTFHREDFICIKLHSVVEHVYVYKENKSEGFTAFGLVYPNNRGISLEEIESIANKLNILKKYIYPKTGYTAFRLKIANEIITPFVILMCKYVFYFGLMAGDYSRGPETKVTKRAGIRERILALNFYIWKMFTGQQYKDYTKKRGNLFLYRLNLLSLHDES